MLYKLEKTIYYDSIQKTYLDLITINKNPTNNPLIKQLHFNKISPYEINNNRCLYAFINPDNNKLLTIDDIDVVLNILIDDGFTVDYHLTTTLIKSKNNKNLIYFLFKN